MDKARTNLKQLCPKHPDFKIQFIQVDNLISTKKDQKLFYCPNCVMQDSTFNHQNCQLIKHIIQSEEDQILQNWPPINDKQLLKQLIELSTEKEDIQSIKTQIEQYFIDLKNEIVEQLNICQKNMILQAEDLQQNKEKRANILKTYQQLSRVNELKTILMDNKMDICQKEKQCRMLLDNIIPQYKTITQQLTSLLNNYKKEQIIFNSESAHQIKKSIQKSIKSIEFFNQPKIERKSDQILKRIEGLVEKLEIVKICNNEKSNKQIDLTKNKKNVDIVYYLNSMIDMKMDVKKEYIFRIEIQMIQEGDWCIIGFMHKDRIISNDYCCFEYKNNTIGIYPSFKGASKLVKGNSFTLSKQNEIEIRVCQENSILEILDYPLYNSKLVLQDPSKSKQILHNYMDIYLKFNSNIIVVLNEAFPMNKSS